MPFLPNLSGSNIQDTFQRILHTDGAKIYDGTGSVLLSSSELISLQALNSASVSSTEWQYIAEINQNLGTTNNVQFANITASGNISASGIVTGLTGSFQHLITSAETIEFQDPVTHNIIGKLKFDQTSGLVIKDGNDNTKNLLTAKIEASELIVSKSSQASDFFLIKSGSFQAFKANVQGVMVFGNFNYTPTAVTGGVYYNANDDDFYFGKS
jgi:hypothetical protein